MFQKDKDLLNFWTAIAVKDEFQKVVAYSRAAILEEGGLTPEMIAGVNLLATTLVSMINEQPQAPTTISTGLVHDLQVQRNMKKEKKD